MLQHLYVKNIALIHEVAIDFNNRLNILTGETGAGKSILIGSINIALGHRSSKDLVRKGADKGLVELVFHVHQEELKEKISSLGVDMGEDNLVVISRMIQQSGRSHSRVNGQTVTNQLLKRLASLLIDIHGQHEHQSLLDEQKHIDLLDMFCKEELEPIKTVFDEQLLGFQEIEKQYKVLNVSNEEKERRISMLQHELNEINNAQLRIGEEDELMQQRKKLIHSKRLYEGCAEIYGHLKGDFETQVDVLSNVQRSIRILAELKEYDELLTSSYESLESASIWLDEVAADLRVYIDSIDHDERSLLDIEMRLDLIGKLKRKYGQSVEAILEYGVKAEEELKQMQDIENRRLQLEKKIKDMEVQIIETCGAIHNVRKKTAVIIQKKIEDILGTLQFEYTKFVIDIKERKRFNEKGLDDIRFLISTNIGEDVKPLSDIASGGEMSRIMLALKTVLAEIDEIPTLIFDEIDTGISGRTAQKVAEKLAKIATYRQVLCITHLPQIAAMSDQHLLIEKSSNQGVTTTDVRQLSQVESEEELARLLSGVSVTETTLQNAKEIIALANSIKNKNK